MLTTLNTYTHLGVDDIKPEMIEEANGNARLAAEQFAKLCWDKFGNEFSSCNVANYKQNADNRRRQ